MYPNHIPHRDSSKLVRLIWSDFERWAVVRRTAMERRCEEISKQQDAKWRATPIRSRIKQEDHEIQKTKLLRETAEDHYSKAREEWQSRLETHKLEDQHWGVMTAEETNKIERVLGGDLVEPEVVVQKAAPTAQQLPPQQPPPQQPTLAPPLSSTARGSNTSASSYTFVSPADFTTDDELYEAVSSYIVVSFPLTSTTRVQELTFT